MWEYLVEAIDAIGSGAVQDRLNQLGTDGWELVAVRTLGFMQDAFVLKRELRK